MNNNLTKHYKVLELPRVLEMLCGYAGCEETKRLALEITPAQDLEDARRQLSRTVDANTLSNQQGTPSIYGLRACGELLGRARVGAMLSPKELLDVCVLLKTGRNLLAWKRQAQQETALDGFFTQLTSDKELEDDITTAIISEDEISDGASPELADIRRKMRQAAAKARDVLDRMVKSSTYQKYLQEQIITQRGGRFVVPVRTEYKGEVKGLVHDVSSSGATVFVEPMAVVEENNRLRELESRESAEITRILLAFSERVGERAGELQGSYDAILQLDLIFSKSRLADAMRASVPILEGDGETVLKKARHPLIPREEAVPIDIRLGGDFDTLVITGPNTGGKTVALKTLGLLTLMACCGLMIPAADESRVRFFPKVLADIGDEQSIEQSLSTFSGHMTNIVSILSEAGSETLVLIDELGAGTDPIEGAALAVAIIESLRRSGAKIAATTHYAEIKMYALQTPGVENASCEFDIATLRPTYKLLIGLPGRSNAFAISERLGLPTSVIEAARAQVSSENARFEDVVSGLEQTRRQLEYERDQARRYREEAENARIQADELRASLEERRERELALARDQARGIVEQVRYQSQALLDELESLKKRKDQEDFSATVSDIKTTFKAYLKDLEAAADPVTPKEKTKPYRLPRPLKAGDSVRLDGFGSDGVVVTAADKDGFVTVQAGILKTRVHQSELRLNETSKTTLDGGTVSTRQAVSGAKEQARAEVDLRGMTSDEAILELERFIDTAVLGNIPSVTIIHGKGTGALRKAVQQRLRSHKSVRTFRAGAYGEGEAGVTIAELR